MAGIGAYNLVLPPGWRFDVVEVDNPNYSGSEYMVARDNEGKREAVMLYFEGTNTRFNLVIQAARDSRASDSHELGPSVCSRHIVEPSPMDTDTQTVLAEARTDSRLRIAPQSKPFPAVGVDVQDASATETHTLVKGEIEIGRREEKGQELRDSNTIFSASSQSQVRSASIQPAGTWKSNQDADREIDTSEVLPLPIAADFYTQIAPIIEQFTSLEEPPDPPRRVTRSTVFRWNVEMATWIRDVEAVLDAAYRIAKTREREGFPSVELAQMAADARAGLRELRNLIKQHPELIDWKLDPAVPQGIRENVAGVVALAANS
jgi:hypothetical protein